VKNRTWATLYHKLGTTLTVTHEVIKFEKNVRKIANRWFAITEGFRHALIDRFVLGGYYKAGTYEDIDDECNRKGYR
jgi:hypothetical protein